MLDGILREDSQLPRFPRASLRIFCALPGLIRADLLLALPQRGLLVFDALHLWIDDFSDQHGR